MIPDPALGISRGNSMRAWLLIAVLAMISFPANAQVNQTKVSGTVATAAPTATVFSSVLASSINRQGCVITNVGSTQGYCQFKPAGASTPTTANSVLVNSGGGQFNCSPGANVVVTDEVDCTCASGTCAFVVNSTGQ